MLNVEGEGLTGSDHVRIEKMNASEPLMKRRENFLPIQTAGLLLPEESSVATDLLLARGGRRIEGMISIQAYLRNRGSQN